MTSAIFQTFAPDSWASWTKFHDPFFLLSEGKNAKVTLASFKTFAPDSWSKDKDAELSKFFLQPDCCIQLSDFDITTIINNYQQLSRLTPGIFGLLRPIPRQQKMLRNCFYRYLCNTFPDPVGCGFPTPF